MHVMKSAREMAGIVAMSIVLTGCSPETWLGSSDRTWLWVVTPLAVLLIFGSSLIFMRRRSQLSHWTLDHPKEPSVQRILVWTLAVSGAAALIFTLYNLSLEIDPSQKIWNIGSWWLGTAMGVALALLVGLKLAEPRPRVPENGR